ncbi:hypothetical protein EVAR_40351_1 [Eumeta japonica]|uniref:Uncharacterized protein n=1 Tax=Eumeta variegata TaxID=151549 RepID=A0A4C1XJ10_EUMVA|nr:hypothetical protein EVAR_40351_1 [Eumeta japonica]
MNYLQRKQYRLFVNTIIEDSSAVNDLDGAIKWREQIGKLAGAVFRIAPRESPLLGEGCSGKPSEGRAGDILSETQTLSPKPTNLHETTV